MNKIFYISKFKSEISYKLIIDSRTNILIRCNNEKLNFILENQGVEKNVDCKICLMQILFNPIF